MMMIETFRTVNVMRKEKRERERDKKSTAEQESAPKIEVAELNKWRKKEAKKNN